MTTPVWKPGTVYRPGDFVQPAQSVVSAPTSLVNADFETGDLTGWVVTREGGAGGTFSVASDRPYAGTHGAKWLGAAGTSNGGGTASIWKNAARAPVKPGQVITVVAYIAQDDTGSSANWGAARVYWFDEAGVEIPTYVHGSEVAGNFSDYRLSQASGAAPVGAAFATAGLWLSANGSGGMRADSVTWNHVPPPFDATLIYKAVQAEAGTSAADEPDWPGTLGVQVVDGGVTWEAVSTSRVVWEARPILKTDTIEPVWPTEPGGFVSDGTVSWECVSRVIEDENCPHGTSVVMGATKIFVNDGDITRFCATANPLDWTTPNDAGYLPTGLQQANANDMKVLALYRSNLAAMNANGFQLWQIDPDPAAMAQLDQMEGVGSTHQQAAQAVANDLFYLSQQGVRSVGIAGASTNLQAGDVGMPIDVLVQAALAETAADPIAAYYPGQGQYWLAIQTPDPPAPIELSGSFANATAFAAYSGGPLTVTNGAVPYTWNAVSASMPPGLSMGSGTGIVTGTPTATGTYYFDVTVVDANGATATGEFSIKVNGGG